MMSIGPLFPLAGAAGTPPAQTIDPAKREDHDRGAASAAGIGAPDGDHLRCDDRDVDGRRAWEPMPASGEPDTTGKADQRHPRAKDPSGQSGSQLDLTV